MNRHDRDLKDLLMAVSEGEVGPGLAAMAAEQYQRIFGKKRRLSKPAPTSSAHHDAEREKKRQGRRERVAAIRAEVMARAKGKCEFCKIAPAAEMHHCLPGIGRRRAEESVQTVAHVCVSCHRDWHRGNDTVVLRALWWAEDHTYYATAAALQKRLDKIYEAARRAAPEREDGR